MQERRTNAERSAATRKALIATSRELFIEKGYAATGTPELVERAGVTRGALYHHFEDKQALFRAVVEAEAAQVAETITAAADGAGTHADALHAGAKAYFAAMREPGRVRLLLLDGPAVLGPAAMWEIDKATAGGTLRAGFQATLEDTTHIAEPEVLADLVSAMFDRAVLAESAGGNAPAYEAAVNKVLAILGSATAG